MCSRIASATNTSDSAIAGAPPSVFLGSTEIEPGLRNLAGMHLIYDWDWAAAERNAREVLRLKRRLQPEVEGLGCGDQRSEMSMNSGVLEIQLRPPLPHLFRVGSRQQPYSVRSAWLQSTARKSGWSRCRRRAGYRCQLAGKTIIHIPSEILALPSPWSKGSERQVQQLPRTQPKTWQGRAHGVS